MSSRPSVDSLSFRTKALCSLGHPVHPSTSLPVPVPSLTELGRCP